jgi:phosphoribosylformylglycinamidine synthase
MHAWEAAGANPTLQHINAAAGNPSMLDEYQIVTIPGGFSYGDDIAAGTILAQRILHDLAEPLRELVERGGGILGICNGFQVLVKAGLLPGGDAGPAQVTVTFNDSARFEARWVRLEVCTDHCVFLAPAGEGSPRAAGFSPRDIAGTSHLPADEPPRRYLDMPVEHAEGKVVTVSDTVTKQLQERGQIAVRYVDADGRYDRYPANPNGSMAGIAGLCDPTGRIFGLMPHPDRHFDHAHHPLWTRRTPEGPPDGLTVFLNAVQYWK